jgi:hypothetical protein
MIQHTTSTSNCHSERSKASASSRSLAICHSERSEESDFSFGVYRGGSSGSAAGCAAAGGVALLAADFADGVFGFAQPEHSAAGAAFFEFVFPAIKYLRIFSRRFGPSPRIASKSSTLLNAPYDFRICKILSAVAGPIPGTCCSSSDVAALMFTGFSGGFFFPPSTAGAQIKLRKRKRRGKRNKENRHAMAEL